MWRGREGGRKTRKNKGELRGLAALIYNLRTTTIQVGGWMDEPVSRLMDGWMKKTRMDLTFSLSLFPSLFLPLRHPQPLLCLQPAFPAGLWPKSELRLCGEASELHTASWRRPTDPPVWSLIPKKGDGSEATGKPATKVN